LRTYSLFLISALALVTSQAQAKPVTVEYTAIVKRMTGGNAVISASDLPGYKISVGETVTGYFSYDSDIQMTSDGPNLDGQYLLVGGFSQALKFTNGNKVSFNYDNYLRTYEDVTPHRIFAEGYDSATRNYKIFSNFERFGEYINSHGFLPEPELWSQFNGNNYFDMWYTAPDLQSSINVGADITSFRVINAVPEPTTYAMLGIGLGLMGVVRRNRQARCAALA
jgi:PEP-CTERM motif